MDFEQKLEQARMRGEIERANKAAENSNAALFVIAWIILMWFIIA